MKASKSHWPLSLLGGGVSAINLITPLILVRMLSPEAVGHYKVFFLYLVLVPWFCLTAGIPNGLSHWAGYQGQKRAHAFHSSWTILLMASLAFLALGWTFSGRIATALDWSAIDAHLFVFASFFTLLAGFYEDAVISQGRIWRGALFSSGFELTRNLSIIGSALYFRTIEAAFWAHTVILGIKVALGALLGSTEGLTKLCFDRETAARVIRYAFPVSLAAALSILTNYTDQLVLSRTLSKVEFAIYALGCLTVPPLYIFEQSVNRVLIPRMARSFTQKKGEDARTAFREGVSELSWILFPATIGLLIFADPIVALLFTKKYAASAYYLRLYAFSYFIMAFPFDAVARARGAGSWILGHLGIFSATTVVAAATFGWIFGAPGVLLGMLGAKTLMRLVGIARARRSEGWTWSEMLPWGDWANYFAVMAVASAAAWALREPTDGGLRWLLSAGILFSLIYLIGTAPRVLHRRAQTSSPTKRVIQLTQYLGMGGLERVILSLAEGLKTGGQWAPSVFVYDRIPGNPTLHPEFAKQGIPVVDFDKGAGFSLKTVFALTRETVRSRAAVIHSHDLGALIYAVSTKILLLGAVRVVHTQHSFVHLERNARYRRYEKYFSIFADSLCTVSEGLRTQYRGVGIDPSAVHAIGNGVVFPSSPPPSTPGERRQLRESLIEQVSDPEMKARVARRLDRIWVLCMARMHERKGQEHIIDLWARVAPDVRRKAFLIFVGQETSEGALAKVMSRVNALDEPEDVAYVGYTRSGPDWLRACEIFASGSEFEGMPLGPIEAAGAGMKLILTDIPGHGMVPGAVTRFDLARSADESPKLAALISELGDPESALRARSRGWDECEGIRHRFGIEVMAERYQKLYEEGPVRLNARFARLLPS